MNITLGIGIGVRRRLIYPSLSQATKNKFLVLWLGDFQGDNLLSNTNSNIIQVTNRDFVTTYIPATSESTFSLPDTEEYRSADSDNFWFSGENVLEKTTAQLVASDLNNTIVKYSDIEPYHIWGIAILKSGETLTSDEYNALSYTLWLHWLYFGTTNDYGHLKDNRNT